MAAKQVWHTPTQIFQPYYAHAIARYLVAEYKLHNYPYDDLVIYELVLFGSACSRYNWITWPRGRRKFIRGLGIGLLRLVLDWRRSKGESWHRTAVGLRW